MRLRHWMGIGWLCCWFWAPLQGQNVSQQVDEANRLYREGAYEQARQKYLEALKQNPDLPELHFNLGDALYKSEDYEKALESFKESLGKASPELQANAWYNLGNALFRKGDLQPSLEAFKESLRLNPSDPDAKHNLEYVLKQIRDQPQQNQPSDGRQEDQDKDPQDQQQDQKNQDRQNRDQQDPQEQNSPDQKQNQEKQEPEEPSPGQKQDQQSDPESSPSKPAEEQPASQETGEARREKMSPEEVQRILNALQEDPEQFLKRKVIKPARVRVKKDW